MPVRRVGSGTSRSQGVQVDDRHDRGSVQLVGIARGVEELALELLGTERLALHLVVADARRPGTGRAAAGRAGRGSSPARAPARSARSISPRFAGNGLRWRRCACAIAWPALAHPPAAGADRAVGAIPSRCTSTRASPCGSSTSRRDRLRDPVDLGLPGAHHQVVVGRVVGDVARAVRPSPGRRCGARARRAGDAPRAGPASRGRAGTGRNASPSSGSARWRSPGSIAGRSVDVRDPPRLGAVGEVAVGQQHHRRHVGDARSGPPRWRRRSSRRATAAATIGTGPRRCGRTSPAAGRPARSWSAGRSTGRRAARRRSISGSSVITARPIVSASARCPGRTWW